MENFEIYSQNDPYKLDRDKRWPVVYILKNEEKIYIGETTNIYNRMNDHNKDEEKALLSDRFVVKHNKSNKSAMFLLESDLINRAFADKTYELMNTKLQTKEVIDGHDFYNKDEIKEDLKSIWEELRSLNIFTKSYHQIENEELFKYSPWKQFDNYQTKAIEGVVKAISKDENAFVQGSAGTGKTLVIIRTAMDYVLENEGKTIGIFSAKKGNHRTFNRVLKNLNVFFRKRIKVITDIRDKDLKNIDYLLVDEAQRMRKWFRGQGSPEYFRNLEEDECKDEIAQLKNNKVNFALYYDLNQAFHKYDLDLSQYVEGNKFDLISQYRMKAGDNWTIFVKDLLQIEESHHEKLDINGYDFKVFDSQEELYNKVLDENNKHDGFDNKSRMLASLNIKDGKWKTESDFDNLDKAKETNYSSVRNEFTFGEHMAVWNKSAYYNDWLEKSDVSEVGCVHTAQGRDFRYAGVIFGEDISIENGKIIATDEVKRSYFILLTRGIYGTGLYTADPQLKKYIKNKCQ